MEKNDLAEAKTSFAFKSGLDILDFKNGKLVTPRGHKPYYSTGIEEGSYVMFIGRSGSGKTSLAIQMACNIVRPYENGEVYLDDVEAATSITRVKQLSGWSDDEIEEKFIHRNVGITSEEFYRNINKIYKLKMEMKDQLTITTDKVDDKGQPIEIRTNSIYFWIH